MKTRIAFIIVLILLIVAIFALAFSTVPKGDFNLSGMDKKIAAATTASVVKPKPTILVYKNSQYGFTFSLPLSWKGYKIINNKWTGYALSKNGQRQIKYAAGPLISIRNPKWTAKKPYQDVPIMVFTEAQWNDLQKDKFHIGAAPIGPSKLDQNIKYVFALPARYNYAFPSGFEEVDKLIQNHSLHAF
jgi:hypothetical protein